MGLSHSPYIVTDGLVLCLDAANRRSYPGSGTSWLDLSGQGNNGTLINGGTFNSTNGGAVVLDGTNDYIKVPRSTILEPTAITMECCFICNSWASYPGIISKGYGPESNWGGVVYQAGYALHIRSSAENYKMHLNFYTNGSRVSAMIDTGITMGAIQHIIVTIGSEGYKVWNKGLLKGSTSTSYTLTHDNSNGGTQLADLFIGAMHYSQSSVLNGRIFFSRVYNRALSADEVRRNYLATKSRFGL